MAQKLIPWNTGGGNIVVNYSGSGNDTVTVGSDTDNAAFTPRSQSITVRTTAGASIARVVTVTQSGKTVPVGTIYNFAYTGTVQSQELPAGTYKLQVWGAQGGSNAADSTYDITSQAGGKGGYSEGILTLTSPTTLYIFVGGQPSTSSTNGGWNGGGGGTGTSTNGTPETATYGLGYTKVGRGGGASDIALVTSAMNYSSYRTNRSSASLLSRFIVAGGGSGGAMAYQEITKSTTSWQTLGTIDFNVGSGVYGTLNGCTYRTSRQTINNLKYFRVNFENNVNPFNNGDVLRFTFTDFSPSTEYDTRNILYWTNDTDTTIVKPTNRETSYELTWNFSAAPSGYYFRIQVFQGGSNFYAGKLTVERQITTTSTTTDTESQVGYVGGGIEGKAGGDNYKATQASAGNRAGFGYGSNQITTDERYAGACGGGGWYGGGSGYINNTLSPELALPRSGGGSGFVNITANAQYRPDGYTGLQLDSGSTYDGTQSFEAVNGGTETGHSGNGYARITRMGSWKAELPTGYTLVEYIENVSSAYINTGVNAADDIGIHIEYEDNYNYGSVSNYIVGARASSSSTILYAISGSSSGNTTTIIYNGTSANLGITRTQGKKYIVDLQADSTGLDYRYVIDGSESKTGRITKTLSATSTPICLFGFNSSNIKNNTRISRCYITDGGDVVRYFLPCRNASNVVGLYDCVNGVFYGSSNSYTFTAGNVI